MFYGLKLLVIFVVTVPATLLIILLGPFDRNGKHIQRITSFWTKMILKVAGVVLNVKGLSQIDPKRQYVFMVNHQSNIDIPVLIQSLSPIRLRWIAKKELLWVPFFGWAMWAAKHITVNRSDQSGALESLKKAKERMKDGVSLAIFPEGTRGSEGDLLPFKRGGFLLAVKTGTPIVPVTINGSAAILPKGDWRIRGGPIEVVIGAPVAVENYRPGTLRALSARIRKLIEKTLQTALPQRQTPKPANQQPTATVRSSLEKPV
jgi:1-acyl-sn-glycerol-3-phosphate acyltransferase